MLPATAHRKPADLGDMLGSSEWGGWQQSLFLRLRLALSRGVLRLRLALSRGFSISLRAVAQRFAFAPADRLTMGIIIASSPPHV